MNSTLAETGIVERVRRAAQGRPIGSTATGRVADDKRQLWERLARVQARGGAFGLVRAGTALDQNPGVGLVADGERIHKTNPVGPTARHG